MSTATRTAPPNSFATSIGRLFTIRPSTRLPALPGHRGEDERDRHAGPHRAGEVALREDDRVAGRQVPGDRPEPDGQAVEVARDGVAGRGEVLDQEAVDPVLGQDAAGQPQPLPVEAHARDRAVAVLPAGDGQRPTVRPPAEERRPVQRPHDLLELGGGAAGGVDAAHDRPHAVRGDRVDRDAGLLEGAQRADVGDAARSAAGEGEHHAGAGPLLGGGCRRGGLR